jgi:hypothetical protein
MEAAWMGHLDLPAESVYRLDVLCGELLCAGVGDVEMVIFAFGVTDADDAHRLVVMTRARAITTPLEVHLNHDCAQRYSMTTTESHARWARKPRRFANR